MALLAVKVTVCTLQVKTPPFVAVSEIAGRAVLLVIEAVVELIQPFAGLVAVTEYVPCPLRLMAAGAVLMIAGPAKLNEVPVVGLLAERVSTGVEQSSTPLLEAVRLMPGVAVLDDTVMVAEAVHPSAL